MYVLIITELSIYYLWMIYVSVDIHTQMVLEI